MRIVKHYEVQADVSALALLASVAGADILSPGNKRVKPGNPLDYISNFGSSMDLFISDSIKVGNFKHPGKLFNALCVTLSFLISPIVSNHISDQYVITYPYVNIPLKDNVLVRNLKNPKRYLVKCVGLM